MMLRSEIGAKPKVVAREIGDEVARSTPDGTQIRELDRSLLRRHNLLKLRPTVSSEEIVEGYYRCVLTAYFAKRYALDDGALPHCINSSHKAVRRVCIVPEHRHARVEDDDWKEGWRLMQERNPEVNVRNPGGGARRADLHVVANGQIVSVEFKYVGSAGLRDVRECAAQLRRHAAQHAEAVLVLYSGSHDRVSEQVVDELRRHVASPTARVVRVCGPEIPVAVKGVA
jgi:hypothetical protein